MYNLKHFFLGCLSLILLCAFTTQSYAQCGNQSSILAQTPTIKAFGQSFTLCSGTTNQNWDFWFNVGTSAGGPIVTLYRHYGFGTPSVELGEGFFTASDFTAVGDNQLSSVKIASGWKVILYDGNNGDGQTVEMTSSGDVPSTFNDKTSSIRVMRQ